MSISITYIIIDSLIFSGIFAGLVLFFLWLNPRLMLHHYPLAVQKQVPPRTPGEKKYFLYFSLAAMLLLGLILMGRVLEGYSSGPISYHGLMIHLFIVLMSWNLVDLLLIDWMLFCKLTPTFVMIPGADCPSDYQNFIFHARGFLKGVLISFVISGLLASVSYGLLASAIG